jgi:poly(A) polymerase
MLLGAEPHDYDVATDARPEQVQALFRKTYAVGAHFGVIVCTKTVCDFQVATSGVMARTSMVAIRRA